MNLNNARICQLIAFAATTVANTVAKAVEVDYQKGDPAVEFAAKDLTRILHDVPGKVALKEDASMEPQAWRLKTGDDTLTVSGRDGMGIAYGVFAFLENHAGVHWLAPDTETVPDLKGWRIPAIDETGKPVFSYREMFVGSDYMDGIWRLRNKESNRASFGVGVHNGSPFDCHTFAFYAKAIKEKRPDLFVGRPNAAGRNCEDLCMSDPEMRELVAKEMCRHIESDAEKRAGKPPYTVPTIYDLSQNDGWSGGECMCPGCKALCDAAGSYSGANIAFVNAVADLVGNRHPEVRLQTFAYSFTMTPPTNDMIAADNVVVRYCKSRIFHPLLPETESGRELAEWSRHAHHLGIWSYWRTFTGELFPFVQPPETISRELRYCRSLGVDRYYVEDEAPLSRSFAMLQHWLLLKLAENPELDENALLQTFLVGYYGAATGPMGDYLAYLVSRQEESRQFLDRDFFEETSVLLDRAEALAADDERSLRHVRWERIVVDRAMFGVLDVLLKQGFAYDRDKVLARFLPNLKDQIQNWGFAGRRAVLEQRIAEAEAEGALYSRYPVPVPEEFAGLETVTLEWNRAMPGNAQLAEDPDAAAGVAFFNPKCDYKLPFSVGYYADKSRGGATLHFETREDVPQDGKFHLYRLGEATVMSPMFFHFDSSWLFRKYIQTIGIVPSEWHIWVSMKFQGPAFVKGSAEENRVLVDRVFFVKGCDVMRGYGITGDNLAPESFRSFDISGVKAGKWRMKSFPIGDPAAMDNGFLVRGTVSYNGVVLPGPGVSRPFVGLWAITKDGGLNDFTIPCVNFYPGDYENVAMLAVIPPGEVARRARRSGRELVLTFRANMQGQEGATVKVENLEIFPIVSVSTINKNTQTKENANE